MCPELLFHVLVQALVLVSWDIEMLAINCGIHLLTDLLQCVWNPLRVYFLPLLRRSLHRNFPSLHLLELIAISTAARPQSSP